MDTWSEQKVRIRLITGATSLIRGALDEKSINTNSKGILDIYTDKMGAGDNQRAICLDCN